MCPAVHYTGEQYTGALPIPELRKNLIYVIKEVRFQVVLKYKRFLIFKQHWLCKERQKNNFKHII